MTDEEMLEATCYSKDEISIIAKILKLHSFSIASAFSVCVDMDIFRCDEASEYAALVITIEKIKETQEDGVSNVWSSEELAVGEWIKDILED